MNYAKLSKEIAHALRHVPWEYELELDEEGWVPIEQLLGALEFNHDGKQLEEADLVKMMEAADKQRYEIRSGKIRALYGHSFPQKISRIAECPPPILFHATPRHLVTRILHGGLLPMSRQYIHLSADKQTAITVGKRKDTAPVLLRIEAKKAWDQGIKFYHGNHTVWLADHIPPQFIIDDSNI